MYIYIYIYIFTQFFIMYIHWKIYKKHYYILYIYLKRIIIWINEPKTYNSLSLSLSVCVCVCARARACVYMCVYVCIYIYIYIYILYIYIIYACMLSSFFLIICIYYYYIFIARNSSNSFSIIHQFFFLRLFSCEIVSPILIKAHLWTSLIVRLRGLFTSLTPNVSEQHK